MIDELFFKYPYQDEEDFLTECDCCQSTDEKVDFEDNWFYTQDDFEEYDDESEYLMGLPNDAEDIIKADNLLFVHDKENNVCSVLGMVEDGLAELVIPAVVCNIPVVGIEVNAFAFNQKLRSIELPYSIVRISSFAFIGCSQLQTIKLGMKKLSVGRSAFYKCHSLNRVVWEGDLTSWLSASFENEFSNPLRYGAEFFCKGEKVEEFTIPDDIIVVPQGAFTGCSSVRTVRLHRNVKRISRAAFAFCENLKTVETCGFAVFSIFREAFFNCFSLSMVRLDGCFAIGLYAFGNCHSLNPSIFKEHHVMYISDEALKGVENE